MTKIEIEALEPGAEAWVCDMHLDIRHVRVTEVLICLKEAYISVSYQVQGIDGVMEREYPSLVKSVRWSGMFTNDLMHPTREEAEAKREERLREFRDA